MATATDKKVQNAECGWLRRLIRKYRMRSADGYGPQFVYQRCGLAAFPAEAKAVFQPHSLCNHLSLVFSKHNMGLL
jgi:hypothetical protein